MTRRLFIGAAGAVAGSAQQSQNPSPMVEHTRPHPRLSKPVPDLPGRREKLDLGTLFIPAKLAQRPKVPLFIHFHGGDWLPEIAAAKNNTAVIPVQVGSGSGIYAKRFTDPAVLAGLLRQAQRVVQTTFSPLTLTAWSAGHGAIREILNDPQAYRQVQRVLLIDGLHTGYAGGKPGPLESKLEPDHLETFLKYARDAVAGNKRMLITHSEIFPGTFAITTETADWLLSQLSISRRAALKTGPMGTQQLSEARRGGFHLIGYAGNSAPDHVDQFHSLPQYLGWFR